ncbi:FkbM family methyltransferase [Pseudomonas costantinii]|uniref:FkbM family methyltransferase n=1 Tax=Pseudomonas costantinii TaxID=168469 RepID=UPI0015A1F217|nr:FkbM family methyltransferase [Pseudomonas costantinii]NVZ72990.1 hypothetical protein [Pseudomonas costantinii]
MPDLNTLSLQLEEALKELKALTERQLHFETILLNKGLSTENIADFNPLLHRNFISNADAAQQKHLMHSWKHNSATLLEPSELAESGFRAFSQNDEDGILLRLFTHIGCTNRYVVEIGSNCSDSDVGIPENLSTNLLVNHGWHGTIFELDATECSKMRYFFARTASTRHYHWTHHDSTQYYSPGIIQQSISPENINELLIAANPDPEPDLFVIDIDGGDFAVMENLKAIKPRVIVVEFEKRFRERYSVVQRDREQFSRRWQQSGAASLTAWTSLLEPKGYRLCAVGTCCFNAFFVREDVAEGKLTTLLPKLAFDEHPVFSVINDNFWLVPDETWQTL